MNPTASLKTLAGLTANALTTVQTREIMRFTSNTKADMLRMVHSAKSGHIGGSLSSAEIVAMAHLCAGENDKIIVSHGHIAPIIYATLGNLGYFDIEEAIQGLRRTTRFEGHPSIAVPGIEWCNGMLGQGLSVGAGFALAKRLKNELGNVFVLMGDGEQQKGQILEAARFAVKHRLNNLTCVIDCNGLQASGKIDDIQPLDLRAMFESSGCFVLEADGHDPTSLYNAFKHDAPAPKIILAQTIMGNGIPEIENDYRYHGKIPDDAIAELAIALWSGSDAGISLSEPRKATTPLYHRIDRGNTTTYTDEADLRQVFADALSDIIRINPDSVISAIDCDLKESMKLHLLPPENVVECGISEHNAMSMAAAMAKSGILTFFCDFGVLAVDETYSQLRMADINGAPIKIIATHCGLDVGEDGKTHQCLDYIGTASQLFGIKIIVPADPNQADHVLRYAAGEPSAFLLACGRTPVPVLRKIDLAPIYDENYNFIYGECEKIRDGSHGIIFSYGTMLHRAVTVSDHLSQRGIAIGVINAPSPTCLNEESVLEAAKTGLVITYEDHHMRTGLGCSVARIIAGRTLCRFITLGVTEYGGSGPPSELYAEQGLNEQQLSDIIMNALSQ